jgi:uncharacterized protein YjdB
MKKFLSILLTAILLLNYFTVIVCGDTGIAGVTYQAHVQNTGWQDWVSNGL